MATYTLLCAVENAPHLRHYAVPYMGIAEEIRLRVCSEFKHLSPLVRKDMELLEKFIAQVRAKHSAR